MSTDTGSVRGDDVAMLNPFFETWLQVNLQRLYDQALAEPVPDELLRLVAQLGETDRV